MANEHMAAEAEERARRICREIGQPESLWQLALPQAYRDMADEAVAESRRDDDPEAEMGKVEPEDLADHVGAALGIPEDADILLEVAGVMDDLAAALGPEPRPEALGALGEPLADIFRRLATMVRVERLRRRAAVRSEPDDLLDELVRRGRIHPSRLQRHHVVTIRFDGYHMTHPLDCDLDDCPHDHVASSWDEPPRPPGTYRFPDVHTLERIGPEDG